MSARLRPVLLAALVVLLGLASGCVHVYQPLSGLHRPIVVDPTAPNFTDLHVTVVCTPGGLLSRGEARLLCDRVGKLFENQGAVVTTDSDRGFGVTDVDLGETPEAKAAPTTDLTMELRARKLETTNDPLSWILCFASATLVPAVTESTFATDVIVRDGTGFLLVKDTLEGRIVRTWGIGTWAGNKILDWVWRKKEDELSSKQVHADVSADLYGQLSQDMMNAKMRWKVLLEATPEGRATSKAP